MKIIDQTTTAGPKTTTLNEIPAGTVFRGNVVGRDGVETASGLWYKADGRWSASDSPGQNPVRRSRDVVVVRLDDTVIGAGGANIITWCRRVLNYEPLDVELVIKGRQS